jgi:hypothetical protein
VRRRKAARERVDADELRHHLAEEEQGEDAEVGPQRADGDVHAALEEEERRQEGEGHDAQALLLLTVLDVVAREHEPEDECGQDGCEFARSPSHMSRKSAAGR